MSANPDRQAPLRLDEERREIDRVVTYAQAGDRLAVRTADALRLDDLQPKLLHYRPVIAHFSGHGSASAGILLTDELRRARPVPPDALSDLFRILRGGLECVVLNACFTDEQAQAIAAHVPCVVGIGGRVHDDAAIRFAAGFYEGVAHAKSIRASFELGRNRLGLYGHTGADVLRFLAAPGAGDRPVIEEKVPGA